MRKQPTALGHDWDEGTTYSDAIVYTCKRCGEQKKEQIVHMHNYQLVSETMATCISEGKRTYQCSCGDEYTESVPATGHNWKETGTGMRLRMSRTVGFIMSAPMPDAVNGTMRYCRSCSLRLHRPRDSNSSSSTVNPGDSSGEASSTSYTEESETFE